MQTPQRRPYEMCFMVVAVLAGLGYLTTVPAPASVAALMPGWLVGAWAWTLLGSGLLGLVGCLWWGRPSTGLGVERAALGAQSGALLVIAGATYHAWATGGVAAFPLLGLLFLTAWLAANVWRIRQIVVELKQ
jgi:hypothetical protein